MIETDAFLRISIASPPGRGSRRSFATGVHVMSHLMLRLGDLLHFHPFAHGPAGPKETSADVVAVAEEEAPAAMTPRSSAAGTDDLAFFSLSIVHRAKDPRADLDRLGLIGLGDE